MKSKNNNFVRDGFQRESIENTFGHSKMVIYKKNIIDVPKKHFELDSLKGIVPRPNFNEISPITSKLFSSITDCILKYLSIMNRGSLINFMNEDYNVIWVEYDSSYPKSFLGTVQGYSDKTATKLNNKSLVEYPLHAVFLNLTTQFRRQLPRKKINMHFFSTHWLPAHININHLILFRR